MRSIEEVRAYIRKSARQKLREALQSASQPPTTFSEFRIVLSDALETAGAPVDMVHQVSDEFHKGGSIYDMLYDVWLSIESEMYDFRQTSELLNAWHSMVEYYVRDAVINIFNTYEGNDVELPLDELLERVISIIKFNRS